MDHVNDYKPPKQDDKMDDETKKLQMEGCAPVPQIPPERIKREAIGGEIAGGAQLKLEVKKEEEIKTEKSHKVGQAMQGHYFNRI